MKNFLVPQEMTLDGKAIQVGARVEFMTESGYWQPAKVCRLDPGRAVLAFQTEELDAQIVRHHPVRARLV
jgi:hypothetical protein